MKKKILYSIVSVAVLLVSFFVFSLLVNSKPEAGKDEEHVNVLNVKTEKVLNEELAIEFTYKGRVSSYENVLLSAEVSGRLMQGSIPLKEGQHFYKGQLLAQIYSEDVAASLKAGKSSFMKTLSTCLPDIRIDYPEEYKKWEDFFRAIDVSENLPELPEITNSKEEIYMASNGVLSEYYTLRQKEITYSKYRLYAPFTGIIKSVNIEVGAVTNTGSQIATLIRSDNLEITVPVLPENAKRISIGDEVDIIAGDDEVHKGKVSRKAGFIDASTQSENIYIAYYPKGNNTIMEGEFVNVNFNNKELEQKGFEIPYEALMNDDYVFVVLDGKLSRIHVNVLQKLDDSVIVSGLSDGDILVMESLTNVEEGDAVNPIN